MYLTVFYAVKNELKNGPQCCGPTTHDLRVLLDGLDLDLELVDLTLVGRVWNGQVVHGEGPEGGVELRAEVVPDPGWMEGHHGLVHRRHHLFTGCHVLVYFLLLPVAFLGFLQLVVLRLCVKSKMLVFVLLLNSFLVIKEMSTNSTKKVKK